MKISISILIICFTFYSCQKDKIINQNISSNLTKRTTINDDKSQIIEINYNNENLPISVSESLISQNSKYSISSNLQYDKNKISEINTNFENINHKTILNWKSNNLIEFLSTFKTASSDISSSKGTIEIRNDGLILNFKNENDDTKNLNFKYDSNSNIVEIDDDRNTPIYVFSKFDDKVNPFSSNLSVWMIFSIFYKGGIDFNDLGINNATEIGLAISNSKISISDSKYNENNLLISTQKTQTFINSNISSSVQFEYNK